MLPIIMFILLKIADERINQVSIVNVTTVALYFFSVVGTFVLFFRLDEYRFNVGVQNQNLIAEVLLYSSINLICFIFGVIFVRRLVGLRIVNLRSTEAEHLSRLQGLALAFLFIFCMLVLFNYLRQLDNVAIVVAITEGVNAAKQARSDMGNAFPGKYHWYKLVMHEVGTLLTFIFLANWLQRKTLKALFAFVIGFSYSAFVAIMATEKAPIAWLLIGLFMVYFLVRRDGLVPFGRMIFFLSILLGVLVLSYIYFMGSRDIGVALWSVFSRAFSGSIAPAYFYLEYFPYHQDYLLGRTFPNPGGIMPFEPFRYTLEIMNWKFPELVNSGVVGSAPTVFWGESYANFGGVGVPVVAFIMGCCVAFVSYLVSKLEVNPISIGFLIWLILEFKDLSVTGFSGYFINIYIIFIVLLVLGVLSLKGGVRIRRSTPSIKLRKDRHASNQTLGI